MRGKHLLTVLLASALILTGVWEVLGRNRTHGLKWDSETIVGQLCPETIVAQMETMTEISATYTDITDTIKEMTADSELIAMVRLVSRRQYSPIAVASTATVNKVIKGNYTDDEIVVFQIGSLGGSQEELLNVDREYLLFLGKQDDEQPNTFYIKGGVQGMFYAEGNRIVAHDPRFADQISRATLTGGLTALETLVKSMLEAR
ncbi:MAG: hypothetical protein KGZ41_00405 [Dethiobacter sp.]|jgi:hypothetical protein|nr:hypothetical protein [Dethiobacter sp.]MCL4462303.1 hypothetical protein [Bacillota bacterium]MCL5992950.1 hypothetical protein [Bacillota bacterium]